MINKKVKALTSKWSNGNDNALKLLANFRIGHGHNRYLVIIEQKLVSIHRILVVVNSFFP